MKRLEISAEQYLKILDICRYAVSKDDSRAELRYIRLEVKKNEVRAFSLNGYVLARYTFTHESEEEFVAFIRPVASRPCYSPVVIEVEDNSTVLSMEIAEGKIAYTFKHPSRFEIDADKIIGDGEDREYKIAFDANVLDTALAALKKHHRGYFVFNVPDNPNKPALLTVKTDIDMVEQLVLPVRMYNGEV